MKDLHFSAPLEIESARLSLRKIAKTDALQMFERLTGDIELTRMMVAPRHATVGDTDAFIADRLKAWDAGERWSWAIVWKHEPEKLIGRIGLNIGSEGPSVGFIVARDCHRQGVATEAVEALMDVALLSYETLFGYCDVDNAGSARVLESAGFQFLERRPNYLVMPNNGGVARDCFTYRAMRSARG